MTIALIGPSGAGKGTQASRLVATRNLLHISTGDLFRDALDKRTALGFLTRQYMNAGELVPDEVVGSLIEEWMVRVMPGKEILFDGFPRNRHQATLLDELSRDQGRRLRAAIYLKVSDEEISRRLPGRIICRICQTPYHTEYRPPAVENCCDLCRGELQVRDDDSPETISARIRTSHRTLEPLLDHYAESGKLVVVDGHGTVEEVYEAIQHVMDSIERDTAEFTTPSELHEIQPLKGTITAISANEANPTLDIILVGGPGSGKGTQAHHLTNHLHLEHISTGDLFRDHIRSATGLGKLAQTYIENGELVPDNITEAMVAERLEMLAPDQGFILDGFPRTTPQAEALTEIMNKLQRRLSAVLHIEVTDDVIVERLSNRLTCRSCQTSFHRRYNPPVQDGICDQCGGKLYIRDDDNPDTIRTRLKTYHRQTEPLISYYRKADLLTVIDGELPLNEVTQSMIAQLQRMGASPA